MEDFDVFTNEIEFSGPAYKHILNKYVTDIPCTPNGPNYEKFSGPAYKHILNKYVTDIPCTPNGPNYENFYVCIPLSNHLHFTCTAETLISDILRTKEEASLLNLLPNDVEEVTEILKNYEPDELPLHKKYMRFSSENNVNNFLKILKQFPKEWTIIQLTAPYNPNENLKPFTEYRTEISSIYLTLLTNDYMDHTDIEPFTVEVPANITKVGEKPLFEELYSLLIENYNTIEKAQFLNNKRLIKNYWSRREDIDLRIKSVINVMYKEWLGGWSSLLTGKFEDSALREKVIKQVDTAISDWGFIKLTSKQKTLLYNLLGSSILLSSQQIKSCIRMILTQHGNPDEVRQVLTNCESCSKEFRLLNELCFECLSECFEKIHHFNIVDGIKAFSDVATQIKDGDEWTALRKAKRHPVILIVDEMLDTFPWETLPILNHQPVSRIENIHFLYSLYKEHEDKIVDGYFAAEPNIGRYVINPDKNLERMELRMSSFVKYWCESWSGHIGEPPPPEEFLDYLSTSDIFLYCGHGDGCHFAKGAANGAGVEGASGRTTALLSGCGSVRLSRAPGRTPPSGAHHHLHIASCPIVIGMLWEVTDLEVDKVVSTLLSLYVPSDAPVDWKSVGKAKWSQGLIETSIEQKSQYSPERDLLLAVSRARGATSFTMIASSLVARGLPVRIRDK
ncbi:jg17830 [Pararge aegeria aegeria]|uniref:separase n=1 Tax=Pararge aegeria aegeria TaxID=348720 RepID=A0A8S4SCZ8_9NEOP|nr:jg17830 [Pararge aegeria aegeria]